MKSKKRILVTGASGTVGFEVINQLLQLKKYDVVAYDINTKKSQKKLSKIKGDLTVYFGDISKKESLEEATQNIDTVIHLAAIIPPFADEHPELAYQVNTIGTKNLIASLEKNSKNAFLLYSSSISVYGDRLENPYITVNDKLLPSKNDEYAVTKIHAEKAIQKSKLNWSIFRLGAIMGGHKMSKLMFHQPLNTSMEIATPQDTARAFVKAINKQQELSKQIFNLGGGEDCRISYEDFLKRSFAIFGLGSLDFPENTFAEKNFHCGFYADGDDLETILQFRQHTLEDYFEIEKKKVSDFQKAITSILKKPIKYYLQKQSEPLVAIKNNDTKMIHQFFNS